MSFAFASLLLLLLLSTILMLILFNIDLKAKIRQKNLTLDSLNSKVDFLHEFNSKYIAHAILYENILYYEKGTIVYVDVDNNIRFEEKNKFLSSINETNLIIGFLEEEND